MKNIEIYGVTEINKIESSQINGGEGESWLFRLGASAHRTWNSMVDGYLKTYTTTHIWGA